MNHPLEWYKIQVDLVQIMLRYGFYETKTSSPHNRRLKRIHDNGDKELYVVKRNSQNHFTYWSPYEDDVKGSTIIDFVGLQLNLTIINQICSHIDILLEDTAFKVHSIVNPESNKDISVQLNQLSELTDYQYFENRGISKETVTNCIFSPVTKCIKKKHYSNIAYYLYNESGVCGLNVRNQDFSRNYGNRKEGMCLSANSKNETKLNQLIITESVEDGMAYHELFGNRMHNLNIRYAASSGSLTTEQISLCDKLVRRQQVENVLLAFDNDNTGFKYALQFLAKSRVGVNEDFMLNDHEVKFTTTDKMTTIHVKWDVTLNGQKVYAQKIMQLVTRCNEEAKYFNGTDQTIVLKEMENNMSFMQLVTTKYNLKLLCSLICELKYKTGFYELGLALTKDFNEDLQAFKGLHNDWILIETKDSYELTRPKSVNKEPDGFL